MDFLITALCDVKNKLNSIYRNSLFERLLLKIIHEYIYVKVLISPTTRDEIEIKGSKRIISCSRQILIDESEIYVDEYERTEDIDGRFSHSCTRTFKRKDTGQIICKFNNYNTVYFNGSHEARLYVNKIRDIKFNCKYIQMTA